MNTAGLHRGTTTFGLWPSAVSENFHERPGTDPSRLGAWCYADRLSYAPGERLRIHISTTAPLYDLRIYRDGAEEVEVFAEGGLSGHFYKTPPDSSVNGCGWPVAIELQVPPGWRSGGYILHIRGWQDKHTCIDHHFPIVIRAGSTPAPGAILLIACTATWVAYNDWGGSNFYEGIEGPDHNALAPIVSTLRPFSRGFAWLPEGAPRIPLERPPRLGAALRYPHMEWAYANGFSKKYASSGWASYERHFIRWAEAQGFSVDVATQHDLDRDRAVLDGYACIAIVGHDEYWSWKMRDAVDAYVDRGGRVARFAGNFLWQTRIESEGTRQVCYKSKAQHSDPVRNITGRKHLLTAAWEDLAVNRPGALTFGLNGSRGIYAGWGGCAPRGSGGFSVYRPEHWAFAGTDLYYGDQLGAEAKVFGYEVDGCDYVIRNGLPYPTGTDGSPDNLEILALGLATTFEADHGNAGSVFFIGAADAQTIARAVAGRSDEEAVNRVKRGCGIIASFDHGLGSVFNAGSCEWVAGLIARDPFVERITRNVLTQFTQAAALDRKEPPTTRKAPGHE